MTRWLSRIACLLLLTTSVACDTPPEERFAGARSAAENKELPAYMKFFTRRSAAFLRDMLANGSRSKMVYLKDPFTLLPAGDVEEIVVDGNSALVKVKGQKGIEELVMLRENDEWSIDLFSLAKFWQPMKEIGQ